jgi:hypothetical protein
MDFKMGRDGNAKNSYPATGVQNPSGEGKTSDRIPVPQVGKLPE